MNALCTGTDLCPDTAPGASVDSNGCSQVQVDPDDDDDTVPDTLDNCGLTVNPVQQDFNADGEGDHCDDTDGDGLLDIVWTCARWRLTRTKADADGDGIAKPVRPGRRRRHGAGHHRQLPPVPNPTRRNQRKRRGRHMRGPGRGRRHGCE